jgi:hypothetical protein
MSMSLTKLKYNISCWDALKLNYWGITKCGNTSIKHSLIMASNTVILEQKPDKHGANSWVHSEKNVLYISSEAALSNGNINFTVTRHPYDRFISMYKDTQRRHNHFFRKHKDLRVSSINDLITFVENIPDDRREVHFRSQCYYITEKDHILPSIVFDINDTERIENTLRTKVEKMNSINTQIHLNEEQKQKVFRIYQKDFELLGYKK